MTISPLMIYLIDVCDSLCVLTNIVFGVSLGAVLITLFGWVVSEAPVYKLKEIFTERFVKYVLIVLIVSGVGCIFIPSKTVLVQMLVIPPIVNNEQIQELPANVLNFVNDYLKQMEKEKDL